MSEEIKVGDLVIIVRSTSCCGETSDIGDIFTAGTVFNSPVTECDICGKSLGNTTLVGIQGEEDGESGYPLSRLKKINPSTEPERVETQQEITA